MSRFLVAREQGSGTYRVFTRALARAGLSLGQVVAELGSTTAVKEGVRTGLGMSVVSARALDNEIRNHGIVSIRLEPPVLRAFYLVRDRRRAASPLCRAFVDLLIDLASNELALAS